MVTVLRSTLSLPAAPDSDEVEQQPPPPPEPPRQGEQSSDGEEDEGSGDEEDEDEGSGDDEDERSGEDEGSGDDEAPPENNVAPPSDDDEDEDEESDSSEDEETPPEPAPQPNQNVSLELKGKAPLVEVIDSPQGKRKMSPAEVVESPQQKRKALQAKITGSMEAAAPAQEDNHGRNKGDTDMEKQFKEKLASYFYLGNEVLALDEEQPDLFKEPFLKLGDNKATAMDTKIKKLRLAQVRLILRRQDLEKKVTKLLLDLLKSS
ncbi:hypothetical protein E2562_030639 [Oryza meyeriana var. granulata]|uniref:Uncharacterized protein n=1 Tax=Oryza meyeriana var. granulata TaxID=110450 RepID=A0A6G1C0S0_9ORYZ|nr:hypothetical protein E2562_030639 [Oryza meyeriana var. granulata]